MVLLKRHGSCSKVTGQSNDGFIGHRGWLVTLLERADLLVKTISFGPVMVGKFAHFSVQFDVNSDAIVRADALSAMVADREHHSSFGTATTRWIFGISVFFSRSECAVIRRKLQLTFWHTRLDAGVILKHPGQMVS